MWGSEWCLCLLVIISIQHMERTCLLLTYCSKWCNVVLFSILMKPIFFFLKKKKIPCLFYWIFYIISILKTKMIDESYNKFMVNFLLGIMMDFSMDVRIWYYNYIFYFDINNNLDARFDNFVHLMLSLWYV